ncbi:hypothetical protein ACFQL1_14155 [Halomicroarcula sp. GCM10025709]|uniref:hypothetical protein n=1 Tax=Halomicroarcula sp. GCM10025709 TaxID=3252669 RepID=UPI003612E5B5
MEGVDRARDRVQERLDRLTEGERSPTVNQETVVATAEQYRTAIDRSLDGVFGVRVAITNEEGDVLVTPGEDDRLPYGETDPGSRSGRPHDGSHRHRPASTVSRARPPRRRSAGSATATTRDRRPSTGSLSSTWPTPSIRQLPRTVTGSPRTPSTPRCDQMTPVTVAASIAASSFIPLPRMV